MGSRREDVDVALFIQDPVAARKWIKYFSWDIHPAPEYIVFGIDQKIFFGNMTDEEAVLAANLILRDIEIPRIVRELQLWNGEPH